MTVLYTEVELEQTILRQISPGFYVGPHLRWTRLYHVKFENTDGDRIASPNVPGNDGSTSAGVGFTLLANPSWLGSSDPYTSYKLDARKYFDLRGDGESVLAMQGLIEFTSGNTPFAAKRQ